MEGTLYEKIPDVRGSQPMEITAMAHEDNDEDDDDDDVFCPGNNLRRGGRQRKVRHSARRSRVSILFELVFWVGRAGGLFLRGAEKLVVLLSSESRAEDRNAASLRMSER